jgi:CspA family cold shock protein
MYTLKFFTRREGALMRRGRVKWFNNDKGYGFIENGEIMNEDIFVHYSAIDQQGYKSLKEGELVEYTLIETAKGSQAINVREISLTAV